MRRSKTTAAVCFLALVTPGAAPADGDDRRPIVRPAVSERVPFYDRLPPADRKVALHAYDLLWNTTETHSWEAIRKDLRTLVASRAVAGPWNPKAVTALAYCWMFAAYVPLLDDDSLSPFERGRFQRWLLAHRNVTRRFLFAITDRDDVADAVEVLHELYDHSPDRALRHPDLAAAMAIVFDDVAASARQRQDTFHWLTSSEVTTAFDVANLPHELARYLVVHHISRDERRWAVRRFDGDVNLDNVYHDVEYDRDALTGKRPRQLAGKKYTLPNIHDYGGTCGDQTYYA
ncbi:MAG: hypothetical protein GY778_31455, partial [bacterium]|nr:hypothetical protein [bacterium]